MVHQSALQSTRHVIPADFAAGVRKQILGGDSVEAANFLAILLMMTWALFVPKGKHQQSTGCLACNLASRERGYNFTVWLSPPYIAKAAKHESLGYHSTQIGVQGIWRMLEILCMLTYRQS